MPKLAPVRLRALARAKKFIGVKEHPPGTNRGPRVDDWNHRAVGVLGIPWCLSFVHCMYADCGYTLGGKALVQAFDNWATQNGFLVARPFKGDIVCYDWDGDHWDDHVGLVDKVLALRWRGKVFAGYVRTIEGNTSAGNDSNGGEVQVRYRQIQNAKFARIPY